MSGSAFQRQVIEPGKVKKNVSDTLGYLDDKITISQVPVNLLYPSVQGGWRDIVRAGRFR